MNAVTTNGNRQRSISTPEVNDGALFMAWTFGRHTHRQYRLPARHPNDQDPPEATGNNAGAEGSVAPSRDQSTAKVNVYAVLGPPLDGLDWVQTSGMQTVVHIGLPGKDDATDREQVEARKM